jgi:hypothetical protein
MTMGLNWDDEGDQGGLLNSRSSQRCLSDSEIEDFLFDRLSGVTRESVEEHLLVCHLCLGRVEEEEEYVQTVRAAARRVETEQLEAAFHEPQDPPRMPSPRGWPRWGFVFGTVAVLCTIVWVQYRPAPPLTEAEIALRMERRAPEEAPLAHARQSLRLVPDLASVPAGTELEWSVVNSSGRTVDQGSFQAAPGNPNIKLPRGLAAGNYWVRIRKPAGDLVREYALRIR